MDDQSPKFMIPKEAFEIAVRCGVAETVMYGVHAIVLSPHTDEIKLAQVRGVLRAAGLGV